MFFSYRSFLLTLALITICQYFAFSQNTAFLQFKDQMQEKVMRIANEMTTIFAQRCDSRITSCQTKSYDYCQGTAEKSCIDDFVTPGGCIGGGAQLAPHSAVRFPSIVNTNSLSREEQQFVCTSALLEDTFKELGDQNKGRYTYTYFGTNLGSFRIYPSTTEQKDDNDICNNYDPRFRPWYVTGSSSGKNVILLIDRSGSMDGSRMEIAKQAAKAVINTLSNNDFFGVIEFSSSASPLASNRIQRATSEKKQAIIEAINNLSASGSTNYEEALLTGFEMLSNAVADEFGAKCADAQNVFLFLTDGEPTAGETSLAGLKTKIDSQNGPYDITLFTYALGSNDINLEVVRGLACAYKGISFEIPTSASSSELLTKMRGYYTYLAQGVTIERPVWTEPYEDAFGFGRMVTVSMPVYYQENSIRTILGVAGIDIIMEQMTSFGTQQEDILKIILSTTQCYKSSLTACQIEELRSIKCGETCPLSTSTINECGSTPREIFLDPVSTDTGMCCGLSVGGLIGLIIGIVAGLVIVGVVTFCVIRKIRANAANRQPQGPRMPPYQGQPQAYNPDIFQAQVNQGGYQPNHPYFSGPGPQY